MAAIPAVITYWNSIYFGMNVANPARSMPGKLNDQRWIEGIG